MSVQPVAIRKKALDHMFGKRDIRLSAVSLSLSFSLSLILSRTFHCPYYSLAVADRPIDRICSEKLLHKEALLHVRGPVTTGDHHNVY